MPEREHTCCFTGHREYKLPWGSDENDPRCRKLQQRLLGQLRLRGMHRRDGERADDEGAPFTGEEGMRIDSRVQFDLRRELVESAPILMKKAALCADFG